MHRRGFVTASLVALAIAAASAGVGIAAEPVATPDNLVRVKSKKLKAVYLRPGADFRPYHRVMLDPTHVAFRKNWQRNYNSSKRGASGRISESDMQNAVDRAVKSATGIFEKAFADGGYQVVTEPGPDVLRVSTALVNISVSAPDRPTAGRSSTYSGEAGQATLVVEARDSASGALLGRAIDARLAGDREIMMRRTTVSNRADFENLIRDWAKISVNGLTELKASSPINN
jgi:hypothetical protein